MEWWAENGWGLHGNHMQFKPNITPFLTYHPWIYPALKAETDMGILDMLFHGSKKLLKDFFTVYFQESPVEGE